MNVRIGHRRPIFCPPSAPQTAADSNLLYVTRGTSFRRGFTGARRCFSSLDELSAACKAAWIDLPMNPTLCRRTNSSQRFNQSGAEQGQETENECLTRTLTTDGVFTDLDQIGHDAVVLSSKNEKVVMSCSVFPQSQFVQFLFSLNQGLGKNTSFFTRLCFEHLVECGRGE